MAPGLLMVADGVCVPASTAWPVDDDADRPAHHRHGAVVWWVGGWVVAVTMAMVVMIMVRHANGTDVAGIAMQMQVVARKW